MSSLSSKKEKEFKPPKLAAYTSRQIDLFQTFLCNTDEQREQLSNAIPLWDCLPKYALSKRAADKLRKDKKLPSLLKLHSHYLGQEYEIIIQPARFMDSEGNITEHYPSSNEELIEDALRRIATIQNDGFFEDEKDCRSGVSFTIYQLRKELEKHGHTRSYQQIVLSLKILANSIIRIQAANNKNRGFLDSAYLSRLAGVSKAKIEEDPNSKWYVEFHPLITEAIKSIDYRQYNYAMMMSHTTHLARWLHKYLVIKFTYASIGKIFEIRFSTIKRDSALLDGYTRQRDAIKAMSDALVELKHHGVIASFAEEKIFGRRQQIEDVIFKVSPTPKFSSEIRAANRRLSGESEHPSLKDSC